MKHLDLDGLQQFASKLNAKFLTDSPKNGQTYGRKNGAWVPVEGGGSSGGSGGGTGKTTFEIPFADIGIPPPSEDTLVFMFAISSEILGTTLPPDVTFVDIYLRDKFVQFPNEHIRLTDMSQVTNLIGIEGLYGILPMFARMSDGEQEYYLLGIAMIEEYSGVYDAFMEMFGTATAIITY